MKLEVDRVSQRMRITGRELVPRHATYLPFGDGRGGVIDQGLAIFFPAPHSYTAEDVLELQIHGGPVVLQLLLARLLELGAPMRLRVAQPGEFVPGESAPPPTLAVAEEILRPSPAPVMSP